MIIRSISLRNFRNHSEYRLDCKSDTTLILGENGWGKTSILEAIYILLRGKSFRAVDADILKRGEDYYRIEIESDEGDSIVATFDGNDKNFLVLDKKSKRLPKKNKYPVVLFLPSDLNLISTSPTKRRDYFDKVFGQFDEGYSNAVLRYEKALKQRNELLKNEFVTAESLFSWNLLLAKYGSVIEEYRSRFIGEINEKITDIYRSIAENEDVVKLRLEGGNVTNEAEYLAILDKNAQKDIYLGHTSFGVHRDDFVFVFNNEVADGSASRGETRSIILALKFIEADLIYQKTHKKPIILLDDVFSELDKKRQKCLVTNFKDNQVIITSTDE
ncbi:DNA replication and repair protein RecF [Candidatus Saccharibacteria bacterium]|nr:DNA replication and repair protein RecF [Candidatus Saccharibacteria bacterium]